jgi:hypothetical protein
MTRTRLLIAFKAGFALLALAALIAQLTNGLENKDFSVINYFSYFTIESNLFAVVIFAMSAQALALKRRDPELDSLRGAATLYMLITGVVYNLFLVGIEVHTPLPWVNLVLHYIFPVVVLLDWLIDRPTRKFAPRQALLWLIFPLVYAIYTLVRGHFAHWYPYPFIDVMKHGYSIVLLNCLVITLGVIFAALVVARLPAAIPSKPAKTRH